MTTEPTASPEGEPQRQVLTIWHTYQLGTVLGGSSTGDGVAHVMGRAGLGWKWSQRIITPTGGAGAWYIRDSRDKPARREEIARAEKRLREAGWEVVVDVDNTPREMSISEAERAARMQDRAAALVQKAARQQHGADVLRSQAERCFPDNGQPLLVDHHSYPADLARRERGWSKMITSIDCADQASQTRARAENAQRHMDFRQEPLLLARRIRTLEEKLRYWTRELAGAQRWYTNDTGESVLGHCDPTPERAQQAREAIARYDTELAYWREIRDQQIADGSAPCYTRADITKGDQIHYRSRWFEVTRVNPASVSITVEQGRSGRSRTYTVAYDQITGHRRPETTHPEEDRP